MISCNGIAKLLFAVSANTFYDHVNFSKLEVDGQLNHWHTCLSYTKSFFALCTMKMNMQVFWIALTSFQTKRILGNSGSIIYAMHQTVFFKCFQGAVKGGSINLFKGHFPVQSALWHWNAASVVEAPATAW